MPIDICVTNDTTIAIADVMRSVSIVQYQPGVAGEHGRLDEVARHFHVAWSSAVAPVSDDSWLLADAESNLAVLRRNAHGVTADDQRRLETTSEIRLGELVNRIRPISVPASPAAVVLPRAFMATVPTRRAHSYRSLLTRKCRPTARSTSSRSSGLRCRTA